MTKPISKIKADLENYKAHAEDGIHFLTDTSAAPEDSYYGIFVTSADTIITNITYKPYARVTGDITAITLSAGLYIPVKFSTITLGAGNVMLLKDEDND